MSVLSSIYHSGLRLVRKAEVTTSNSTTFTNITTSSAHSANTTKPNYSTGLTGVNLELDQSFVKLIWVSMVGVAFIVLLLRIWQLFSAHLRHIYCLHANRLEQNYWTYDTTRWWPWVKREILYAPLATKRHNREIQLSSAANYGTLPGRLHAILIVSYALSNVAYCLVLPYSSDRAHAVAELRGRSGMLAVVNMVPLVLMAGRNNPAIWLLNISFDTFNLFHRWMGRLVIFQGVVHVSAWYTNYSALYDKSFSEIFSHNLFLTAGLSSILAMSVISIQTLSPIRHAFYEIFLHLHIFLAFVAIGGAYVHLEMHKLPALPYIRLVALFWMAERVMRVIRLLYLNYAWGRGFTYVTVEALPANACRVTFQLPRHITVKPGSHIYAYLPRISLWQSHPFSVAWTNVESEPPTGLQPQERNPFISPEDEDENSLKETDSQIIKRSNYLSTAPTAISLIVAARTGMTQKLYERALKGTFRTSGLVEGPYAGHDSLTSYGTIIMFAGGAGITHHLVQIRHLVARAQARTVATRKILLVWTVRDLDSLSWIRPWMDEILHMPGRREVLSLELYVTKARGAADYASPNATIQLFPRRCDPGAVIDRVLPMRVGATMVTICGPGAFADEVRAAVRSRLHIASMEMNEEAFTW